MFRVVLHKKALRELQKLSPTLRERIVGALRELARNPFTGDVKPIKGIRGLYRRRVGKYRIIYVVDFEENVIVILRIAPREKAYK